MSSLGSPRDGRRLRACEEVEVCALVRLQHVLDVQPLIASPGWPRLTGSLGQPSVDLRVGDVEVQRSAGYVEFDEVTGTHGGQRASYGRFRAHVQDHGSV